MAMQRAITEGDRMTRESSPRRVGQSVAANAKVTEAQVREVLSLHQFGGWKRAQIVERTGLDKGAVGRITSGVTGANIMVTVKDLPADVEPLAEFRK